MTPTLKVALAQITSSDLVDENLKCVQELTTEAAGNGAEVVAFPENTLFFRLDGSKPMVGVSTTGKEAEALRALASQHKIHLLLTTPTIQNNQIQNSTWHLSPEGELSVVYSKIHLFDVDVEGAAAVRESDHFLAGDRRSVIDLKGWKFGLSICYDLRFAELYASYGRQEVDGIFIPSAFLVPTGQAHWHVLVRARAIENQCFVLAPAQSGEHRSSSGPRRHTFGHTLAVDPWGRILSELTESPAITVLELKREAIDSARRQIPMRLHRRLESF